MQITPVIEWKWITAPIDNCCWLVVCRSMPETDLRSARPNQISWKKGKCEFPQTIHTSDSNENWKIGYTRSAVKRTFLYNEGQVEWTGEEDEWVESEWKGQRHYNGQQAEEKRRKCGNGKLARNDHWLLNGETRHKGHKSVPHDPL